MVLLFCNGNSKKTLPGCTTGRHESQISLLPTSCYTPHANQFFKPSATVSRKYHFSGLLELVFYVSSSAQRVPIIEIPTIVTMDQLKMSSYNIS